MVLEVELEGWFLAAWPGLRAPLDGQGRMVQPQSMLTWVACLSPSLSSPTQLLFEQLSCFLWEY